MDLRNIQTNLYLGFDVVTIDGDLEEITIADNFINVQLKSKVIIANTIKGKGRFHGKK